MWFGEMQNAGIWFDKWCIGSDANRKYLQICNPTLCNMMDLCVPGCEKQPDTKHDAVKSRCCLPNGGTHYHGKQKAACQLCTCANMKEVVSGNCTQTK